MLLFPENLARARASLINLALPCSKKSSFALPLTVISGETSRALFAGACELCESCNKESGEPCRHPEQMRYSIEALGGNVAQAAQFYFDDRILWAANGHLPEYFILLGGLLK